MSKGIIYGIIAVIVIGGGAYFASQRSAETDTIALEVESSMQQEGEVMEESMQDNTERTIGTGTLRGLMLLGVPMQCDFEHQDEYSTQSGTVYFSGNQMRGDFVSSDETFGTYESHMIRDNEWLYVWSDAFGNQGTKLAYNEVESTEYEDDPKENVDLDMSVDYDCSTWNVDRSQFDLPQDIVFAEITAEVQQIQEVTQDLQAAQCAACDQITDAQGKAACLQALGC